MMSWYLHEFSNNDSLVTELTDRVVRLIKTAAAAHGHVSLAVSGGRTPVPLFEKLSTQPLPWSDVIVSLVDERWVDEDHADSNAALVRRSLLSGAAGEARFIPMKLSTTDAHAARPELDALLRVHVMPLDIVLLGMGEDGHTASLFPSARGLSEALDISRTEFCSVIEVEGMAYPRMTLTLRSLLTARYRFLYVTGQRKLQVLEQAFHPGAVEELPVRAILHSPGITTHIFYTPED